LVEETEEFVDLLLREVGVVCGVFDFKSVEVLSPAGHYVWERVETWVADWNSDSVVAFFL
jgi:hypothetical protein